MHVPEPVPLWWGREAESNVVAVAAHAGHGLRDEVAAGMALAEPQRLREEDPATGEWAARFPSHLVAGRSRFEMDLNRPREDAVYLGPDTAWGLEVWREDPAPEVTARSRADYDAFYSVLAGLLDRTQRLGPFVVYDLHSYNHRRGGPAAAPADPAGHPDVNVGTGSMDRERWGPVVDRFVAELASAKVPGYRDDGLDVRENVRFRGRHLARWVHERYPDRGCALAIDVKKFYMDEHTGEVFEAVSAGVADALVATIPAVLEELGRRRR